MEEFIDKDNMKPLIDFGSPVSKPLHIPLIPIPITNTYGNALSPTNNNPFDIVAKLTTTSVIKDPFEYVLKNASSKSIDNDQKDFNTKQKNLFKNTLNTVSSCLNGIEYNSSKLNVCNNITDNRTNNNSSDDLNISPIMNVPSLKLSDGSSDRAENLQCENTDVIEHQTNNTDEITINLNKYSMPIVLPNGDSQSYVSGDFSTEEGLKAVIAKRVDKCIQKVLNSSKNLKISTLTDPDNKNIADKKSMKDNNRRSLSFVAVTSGDSKRDKLNKSFAGFYHSGESFVLENEELKKGDNSVDSCGTRPLSSISGEVSKTEDSLCSSSGDNEQVFEEANKLARTLSKIADSFCNYIDSDNEEDLLSIKPRWLHAGSSDDEEEEKLRNDPALNIRVSLTNSITIKSVDSDALLAFRQKRSLSNFQVDDSQNESNLKSSHSIVSKPNNNLTAPIREVPVPVALIKPEENSIKLKKKTTGDYRRGPMRAVMPVQSMTKDSVAYGGRIINNQETSPTRKQKVEYFMETPNKDNSHVGMHPVASSTPHKSISTMPQLLTPTIDMPSTKRRSLGSTLESRKSRNVLVEAGARQRSNSANSSIPAPTEPVKAIKGSNVKKSPLRQKSASSLTRMASNSQKNIQSNIKPAKKSQAKTNFKQKSLAEEKPKSPRTGLTKSTIKTISSFITSKGKKVAAQDKENRVPA